MAEDITVLRYLRGEISRPEAVDAVDEQQLRQAEREAQIVEEDVSWGSTA